MPNWKKVIISGSDAELNSVTVSNGVNALNVTASNGINALNSGFTVEESTDTVLELQGNITASGHLFASLSFDNTPVTDGVVVYDTANGQLYFTGSYGSSSVDPGTTVTANTGDSSDTPLTSITIGGDNFSIAGQDDDWNINGLPYVNDSFISSSRTTIIGPVQSSNEFNQTTYGFSVTDITSPNIVAGKGSSVLGKGLESVVENEVVVGQFNDKETTGKLFSIGNGQTDEKSNVAIFRSKSIDLCPSGNLTLEKYIPVTEGGLLELTAGAGGTVNDQTFDILITMPNYPTDGTPPAGSTDNTLDIRIDNNGNVTLESLHNIGNVTVTNASSYASAASAKKTALNLVTLSDNVVTRIRQKNDVDQASLNEIFKSISVGGETVVDSGENLASNVLSQLVTFWSGSLTQYGGPDTLASLDGNDGSTTITFGSGDPTSVADIGGSGNGLRLQASFTSGVDGTQVTNPDDIPQIEFRIVIPGYSIPGPVLPRGNGLYLGKESDRPEYTADSTFITNVLGGKDHALVLANIDNDIGDDVDIDVAGARILLGVHSDDSGPANAGGRLSYVTFDIKNAESTYGYDRIGVIRSSVLGTGVTFDNLSDKRLKENIKLSKKGLDIIKQVKVRDFNWKKDPNTTNTGFVAQELHKVLPELVVKGGKDASIAPWTVNQMGLIPYMVKAIQEQQKLIEKLQKEIDQLK